MDGMEENTRRPKREKKDKFGRNAAFQKLKDRKSGVNNKYEEEEVDKVYDEVDEKTYNNTVINRQNDDWIVDDGGIEGYVEDGREIFDDDLDEKSIEQASKHYSAFRKKPTKDVTPKPQRRLENMFKKMGNNKKAQDTKLNDNDDLEDLLAELKSTPKPVNSSAGPVRNKFVKKPEMKATEETTTKRKNKEDSDEDLFDGMKYQSKKAKVLDNAQSDSQVIEEISQEIPEVETRESQTIEEPNTQTPMDDLMHDVTMEDFNEDMDTEEPQKSIAEPAKKIQKVAKEVPEPKKEFKEPAKKMELDFEDFAKGWDEDFTTQANLETVSKKDIKLPLETNEAGEKILRFFWWDASEDPIRQPGTVILYGKVQLEKSKQYVSCCLVIKNIPKRIYVLPREFKKSAPEETVSLPDVHKELEKVTQKLGISSFLWRSVEKKYAFEKENAPMQGEYMEVRYPANFPSMDENYSGDTIQTIFGTSVNALEHFLIERNLKGPCWLDVKNPLPTANSASWTQLNVNCLKMEFVSVSTKNQDLPLPPISAMTINVKTALNPKIQQNEIVMIGVLLHQEFHLDKPPPKPFFQQNFCIVSHPQGVPFPLYSREIFTKNKHTNVIQCDTESVLLEELLKLFETFDPDLLVGYDCGFQFDVLSHRINTLKVHNWSRVGKNKRTSFPYFKSKTNLGTIFCGRPMCDIQNSAKELNVKLRSYDLQSICVAVLHKNAKDCIEIKPADCPAFYASKEKLESLLITTMREAHFILSIMVELNVMPLALQITCLCGNILSRTLSAGRAERNEYLLLHAFNQKNFITPDKRNFRKGRGAEGAETTGRKKPQYAGGLVLEPQKGLYDSLILLMDFNSLYPSIIQEYNLCFSTVPGAAYAAVEELNIPDPSESPGILPNEIRRLVESRCEVKKLMKNGKNTPEQNMQYNIRQLALKLTANSMYGCLGASHCRFYAKGLAALVTMKGREILLSTKHLVTKLSYDVVYGDTDSIMINTKSQDYEEVFSIGKKIKQEINKHYKKIELDIDGVFKHLLLLNKKKYAAVTMSKNMKGEIKLEQELKGLDMVRRDWCPISSETGRQIVNHLLCDDSLDTRLSNVKDVICKVGQELKDEKVPLQSLEITKQLSKNPSEYPDKKQPHVSVALRLNSQGGRMFKSGDTIPYIICKDGTDKTAVERAYHMDELKKSDSLKVDVDYYLLSQVFPVVVRLIEPIDGIDDVIVADLLGVGHLHKPKRSAEANDEFNEPLIMDEDRFKYCTPLRIVCLDEKCGSEILVKNLITECDSGHELTLSRCSNPDCKTLPYAYPAYIQNQLQMALRAAIKEYYDCELECENPACGNVTNEISFCSGNKVKCTDCGVGVMHRVYSETKLYNQILYYLNMFDTNHKNFKALKTPSPRELISLYETLKEQVERFLRRNAYSVVNLESLFMPAKPTNSEFQRILKTHFTPLRDLVDVTEQLSIMERPEELDDVTNQVITTPESEVVEEIEVV